MPKIPRERRRKSPRSGEPLPALVPTLRDILRRAFPPGTGVTPWATRPGRPWECQECGAHLTGSDLALAKVRRRLWGTQITWQASEWRHFVQIGIPGDGITISVEAALRQVLETRFAAVRWDAETQTLKKARGGRPDLRLERRSRR